MEVWCGRRRAVLKAEAASLGRKTVLTISLASGTTTGTTPAFSHAIDVVQRELFELPAPVALTPCLTSALVDEAGNIENLQVAVAPPFRHREHEAADIFCLGSQSLRSSVECKDVPYRIEIAKQHLEAGDHGSNLRHDKDETLDILLGVGMNRDLALDLDEC